MPIVTINSIFIGVTARRARVTKLHTTVVVTRGWFFNSSLAVRTQDNKSFPRTTQGILSTSTLLHTVEQKKHFCSTCPQLSNKPFFHSLES